MKHDGYMIYNNIKGSQPLPNWGHWSASLLALKFMMAQSGNEHMPPYLKSAHPQTILSYFGNRYGRQLSIKRIAIQEIKKEGEG